MSDLMTVRPLQKEETESALLLAWKVFAEYESPDYAPEGTDEFKKALNDEKYLSGIRYYGAFDEDRLTGILGIREEKAHIQTAILSHRSGKTHTTSTSLVWSHFSIRHPLMHHYWSTGVNA